MMNRIRVGLCVSLIATLLLGRGVVAQSVLSGRAPVRSTASAQIALAREMMAHIPPVSDPAQRLAAVLNVIAATRVVSFKWPDDRKSVAEAALVEGETYYAEGMYAQAFAALTQAEPASNGTEFAPRLNYFLGETLCHLKRFGEARDALSRAEHDGAFHRLESFFRMATYEAAARAEGELGLHGQASAHLRKAADEPAARPLNQLTSLRKSLEHNLLNGDRSEAKNDLSVIEHKLDAFRSLTFSDADRRALQAIEVEAEKQRADLGR